MKLKYIPHLILLLAILSCDKDISVLDTVLDSNGLSYNDSFGAWQELKSTNGNSYSYQTSFVSWAAFGSTTTITVENGKIIKREYEFFHQYQPELAESYIETESEIGTNERGALPKTIDELYGTCAREYLMVNEKDNTIYFETFDETGIISTCGFVPKGCADDCFTGMRLINFKWQNTAWIN